MDSCTPGGVQESLLAKNLKGDEEHADPDFTAWKHPHAERQTLAKTRLVTVRGHHHTLADVAQDGDNNHMNSRNPKPMAPS